MIVVTEEALEKSVLNLVSQDLNGIYLLDIFNDEFTSFSMVEGRFTVSEKKPLSVFLDEFRQNVDERYMKEIMSIISIPKLQEERKNGNDKMLVSYKTFNNKSYTILSKLIETDNGGMVLLLQKQEKEFKSDNVENNIRFNSLVDSLSDAIIKVQNVFGLDKKKLSDIKNAEGYINSVFSSLINNYPELKSSLNKTYANVSSRKEDTILIVDDDVVMRNMIKKIFAEDYKIVTASNGKEALDYLNDNENKGVNSSADHVIGIFLDLTMPVLDGFAVLEYLSKKNYLTRVPVIIISGDYEKETRSRVYNYNIADMLEKPFDFEVVKHRISNFINLYKSSNSLNDLISNQNEALKDLINPFIEAYRYDYKDNIRTVGEYVKILASKVMEDYPGYNLTNDKVEKMSSASTYYDVGFYSIPRKILAKDKLFTNEDIDKVKKYPLFGAKMIEYLLSLSSDALYKEYAINIAKYYHENYDGSGYPEGLSQDNIPLESQIASVCIMYNNLKRKGSDKVKDIIASKSGVMFNPKIIESFIKAADSFENVS